MKATFFGLVALLALGESLFIAIYRSFSDKLQVLMQANLELAM